MDSGSDVLTFFVIAAAIGIGCKIFGASPAEEKSITGAWGMSFVFGPVVGIGVFFVDHILGLGLGLVGSGIVGVGLVFVYSLKELSK